MPSGDPEVSMASPAVPHSDSQSHRPSIKTRAGHKKARTGCLTCKARRVKCDETRPGCTRCILYSGVCSGYGNVCSSLGRGRTHAVLIVPKPSHGCQQISYSLSTAMFKTEKEQRYLSIFCSKIAAELAGYFQGQIWTRLVVQGTQVDTSIRHGVVAIVAASFLRYRQSSFPWIADQQITHQRFALQHYDIAIKELRNAVSRGNQNLEMILITCFIIICFENIFGSHESAATQTNAALKLMFENAPHYRERQLDEDLVHAFVRLDVQTLSFKDTRSAEVHMAMQSYRQNVLDAMPQRFLSINQAKTYFVLIMQKSLHLLASVNCEAYLTSDMNKPLAGDQRSQMEAYWVIMQRWKKAFQPLLGIPKESLSPQQCLVFESLQLHYMSFDLIISGSLDAVPNIRKYMPNFKAMVLHGRTIMSHPYVKGAESLFTAEIQFVASLFLCAARCPHRWVRREAIALLRQSQRREGLWDSILSANMAEYIMNLKEENGMDGDYVRQDALSKHFDIDIIRQTKTAIMECHMPVPGTDEVVIRKKTLTW